MTVIVTRKPGGVTQLFNTETGRVTFKCKAESAYMIIEAFGGIVKFNQKGAIATVTGHITSLESCDVLKKGHPDYKKALTAIISSHKELPKMFLIHIKTRFRNLKTSYLVSNSQIFHTYIF